MTIRPAIGRSIAALALAAAVLFLAHVPVLADEIGGEGFAVAVPSSPEFVGDTAPLWDWMDPLLQHDLERSMEYLGLSTAIADGHLAVALVDVTDVRHPRVATVNGDRVFYAASLPKIAVLLAVFEKSYAGKLRIDDETWAQLHRMIQESNNEDSTALMHKVGKRYIAEVLRSPRYRLYDPTHNGGLWAGKDYASAGVWKRDPMHNLSHAASAMQVARFYYLLQTGRLVSPEASRQMKAILGKTAIHHKFVKGLRVVRPRAAIYRKSGTWRGFHADGALVERRDGASYIAVGLAASPDAPRWMPQIAIALDRLIPAPVVPIQAKAPAEPKRPWWRFW